MSETDQENSHCEAFEAWWQARGQYGRTGGGDYEKTFAFNAWVAAHTDDTHDANEVARLLDAAVSEQDFEAIPLRHCPFCGPGNSIASVYFDDVARRWRVGCGRCGCSTGIHPHDKTPRSCIESWNRRG